MAGVHKPHLSEDPLRPALRAKARYRRDRLGKLAASQVSPGSSRNDLLPRLELVEREPGSLIIPARNVRKIEPAHLQEVINSIRNFGFCKPAMIDQDNRVLDGVIRVEAGKLLGLPKIPCIRADHLSAAEKRLLRLALNRLGEKGTWNFEELKLELNELIVEGIAIENSGFAIAEIDQIVIGEDLTVVEQGPLAPEPGAKPVARLGDVFVLGDHRIICGDATDPVLYEKLMLEDQARLIFTDEPYNIPIAGNVTKGEHREFLMASGELSDIEFADFNMAWMGASIAHLRDGGILATFIDWRGYPTVHASALEVGLRPLNLVVWTKTNAGMGSLYRSQHELLPFYKKGSAPHINNVELGKNGRWRSNVWTYPGASSLSSEARKGLQDHPTVKPVSMLEDALLDVTRRGDVVLDPFLGSGSTLIAAERTGRCCRGIELDPLYVDVILRRYETVSGRPALLTETGESYAELSSRRESDVLR